MDIKKRNSVFDTEVNSGNSSMDSLLQNLDSYFKELKVANATNFARKGYHNQAEIIISEILKDYGDFSEILDLQARIYAQQGRIVEAEAIWRKALLLDPSNSAYQKALNRISKMQQRPIWLVPLFYLIISLFLIFALVSGTTILVNQIKMSSPPQLSDISQNQNIENELINKLTVMENSIQSLMNSSISMVPPNLDLNISGISTKVEKNELIVIFDEGVFEIGAVLKSESKTLLTELGRQLEPYAGRIYIKIYGITDDIPMPEGQKYHDNVDLGKARASAVFDRFRETTNLIPDKILIGSFGKYLPPFPNDTQSNRSKNRTVILKISN